MSVLGIRYRAHSLLLADVVLSDEYEQARSSAFDCVCCIARLYYQHLSSYMDALFSLTTSSVGKEEQIGIRAIEFWNVICEVSVRTCAYASVHVRKRVCDVTRVRAQAGHER